MRRIFGFIFTITILSSLIIVSSCSEKNPTVGNLHVTLIDSSGLSLAVTEVFISTSWEDQKAGYHSDSAWTNASGEAFFDDLVPRFYWYSAKGWKDYGAVEVYAGEDIRVVLWLNTHGRK